MLSAPKVTKVKWYMGHYSAKTKKPHYGYANSPVVLKLSKGKYSSKDRPPKEERIQTADVYVDAKGVKRYQGNRNLRATENLVPNNIYIKI